MKYNPRVSSSRRKCSKAHFTTPSSICCVLMSAPLSTDHWQKYNIRLTFVRKDDKVPIVHVISKGHEGKIIKVYHRKWVIHLECIIREKVNRSTINVNPFWVTDELGRWGISRLR